MWFLGFPSPDKAHGPEVPAVPPDECSWREHYLDGDRNEYNPAQRSSHCTARQVCAPPETNIVFEIQPEHFNVFHGIKWYMSD